MPLMRSVVSYDSYSFYKSNPFWETWRVQSELCVNIKCFLRYVSFWKYDVPKQRRCWSTRISRAHKSILIITTVSSKTHSAHLIKFWKSRLLLKQNFVQEQELHLAGKCETWTEQVSELHCSSKVLVVADKIMRKEVWVLYYNVKCNPTDLTSDHFEVAVMCLNGYPVLPCGHADTMMMEAVRTSETSVKLLPDYTALQPRRQKSTHTPPREPEISLIEFCTLNWPNDKF
jgi:hypothetical protein